jgi:hypothetical protein
MFANTALLIVSGIKKPYDVLPSRFVKFNITLVSSGCLDSNKNLSYVEPVKLFFAAVDKGVFVLYGLFVSTSLIVVKGEDVSDGLFVSLLDAVFDNCGVFEGWTVVDKLVNGLYDIETHEELDKDTQAELLAYVLGVFDTLAIGVIEGDNVDVRDFVLEAV